jgi:YjbE family integral membrane protein
MMIDWLQQNFAALLQVVMIDLVLAGDNAIIVGLAASRVAPELRQKVILLGIAGAVALRVAFAAVATYLLAIVGLLLAGGLLLLWVCWKMYWELTHAGGKRVAAHGVLKATGQAVDRPMGFGAAVTQIIVADVSMSLDNVLAVAGAAKGEPWVLIAGLGIAILLMAVAANAIANLLPASPDCLDRLARDPLRSAGHDIRRLARGRLCDLARRVVCARHDEPDTRLAGAVTGR